MGVPLLSPNPTTGVLEPTRITYSSSLPFKSGGNTDLEAEVSNSWTLGGVATPRFLPGFSLSVDYYNIKVTKAIQFLSAQFILNQCVDQATIDNPFCAFFTRAQGAQLGHDGQQYGVIDNSLHVTPFNFAKLKARGIDTEIGLPAPVGSARAARYTVELDASSRADVSSSIQPIRRSATG